MSATTHVSLAEYLNYVAPDGFDDELIEGEIVLSPSPKSLHATLCSNLQVVLQKALRGSEYVVRLDTSMVLETHESMPRPDVFVMDRERWKKAEEENSYPAGSPQLAIEVFSPSNTAGALRRKIMLYLQTGSSAVWVVYPARQTVVIHDAEGEREFRLGEGLMLPPPLPQSSIPVDSIFERS